MLETEKAYWSVFRYCYVICHGCQMYFLWNPLSVESLECCHFSIISNKEGVFLLTFLFENLIFTECTNCFYWTFFKRCIWRPFFSKMEMGKRKWMRKEHLLSYICTVLRNFQTAWDLKTMKCKALNISWLFLNNQKEWKF